MCPGGVPGIPSVRGEVCCPTSCLNCGGRGCGTFPGGQGNCCIGGRNGILANSDFCSQTMAAPCRIDDGEMFPRAAIHMRVIAPEFGRLFLVKQCSYIHTKGFVSTNVQNPHGTLR